MTPGRALLIAALVALTAAVPAGPAAASDARGSFSARPNDRAPQDKAGTYFKLEVERGTSRRQSVLISNLSGERKELLLDAVDGLTGTTSGSVYANRDDPRRRAGAWVKLPRKELTLAPRESTRVPFELAIPGDAAPGDHLAGIAVQDREETKSGSQMTVTQVVRVVVGVQIIVDGRSEKALTLGDVALKALPGTEVPSVVIRLENTGTRLCQPTLDVTLTGSGEERQSATRKLDTILPGSAIDYPMPWPRALRQGIYEVAVQAKDCGKPQAVQATAELGETLLGTPDNPEPPTPVAAGVAAGTGISLPVLVGLMVLVAALSSGFMALLLRRRDAPKD